LSVNCTWNVGKFKKALTRDGAYLLRSNHAGWSAQEFWETYIQLTVVERAFHVLKSHLLLRPIWHQYSGRTQAHIFVCVLAYALWKTLDHLAKRANLQTLIRKPDAEQGDAPKPRPMTPEAILRELKDEKARFVRENWRPGPGCTRTKEMSGRDTRRRTGTISPSRSSQKPSCQIQVEQKRQHVRHSQGDGASGYLGITAEQVKEIRHGDPYDRCARHSCGDPAQQTENDLDVAEPH